MNSPSSRKMSIVTISMIIVVSTFGIANVIDNLVELGLTAIPSWLAVGFLYFLPLALILAEFASDTTTARGGIYSYMERGLGRTWAFVGTWSYFAANLIYLQSVFSRLPIRVSLVATGRDVFESAAVFLPILGVGICVAITFVSTRGVKRFSHLSDWVGRITLVLIGLLILVPITLVLFGKQTSLTSYSMSALIPTLDLQYFSTFAWLLFAVAGAEVAAPYVKETRDPARNFPRAILITTVMIGALYVLATIAVSFAIPIDSLTKATGLFDVWVNWTGLLGFESEAIAKAILAFNIVGFITAYVIWMESPIRAMFAEVPEGTFPEGLTRRDDGGTHHRALWTQAAVVCVLILIPMFSILTGTTGSENFISLLNDLSSLSLVIPYIFIALAYIRARQRGMDAPFKMVQSTRVAIAIGVLVLIVSSLGYLGAGLYALQAETIDWIYVAIVYGGPVLLILLGLVLRRVSIGIHRARAAVGR